jgi:hypothetical protein
MKHLWVLGIVLSVAAGCSPITTQDEQSLAKPINCQTAPGDIVTLQSEKSSVLTRLASGATAIQPSAAALSILTGSEKAKLEVASGEYNDMIDNKIGEIKKTCGV